jgi:hypothetical protein
MDSAQSPPPQRDQRSPIPLLLDEDNDEGEALDDDARFDGLGVLDSPITVSQGVKSKLTPILVPSKFPSSVSQTTVTGKDLSSSSIAEAAKTFEENDSWNW